MERQKTLKLTLIGSAALALQGCVAAVFPIAAGGLMAGEGRLTSETNTDAEVASAPEDSGSETAPASASESAPALAVEVQQDPAAQSPAVNLAQAAPTPPPAPPAPQPEPLSVAVTPDPAPAQQGPVRIDVPPSNTALAAATPATEEAPASVASATGTFLVDSSESATQSAPVAETAAQASQMARSTTPAAPSAASSASVASGGLVPVREAAPAVAGGTFFDPFFSYASSPEFLAGRERVSATLIDAAALKPDRMFCEEGQTTVLIDLDPADGKLFPIDPQSASPALVRRLAELRRKGVNITWISESSAEKENDIRVALFRSGLDPVGTDDLLLMRTVEERKQERRDQLAKDACLVAIAGDERSDFHELFDYLLNPSDAQALEPLIGEGWFLIPTPIIAERAR